LIDTALAVSVERLKQERARAFFDELATKDIDITEEQIQSEDFLHAYFATARAAFNTRRREKIRLFARLFANYAKSGNFDTADAYEEMLAVLDDLGCREFQVLLILHRFETNTPLKEGLNPKVTRVQHASQFWDDFVKAVESEVEIPSLEIPGFLARLTRTGLYQMILENVAGYNSDKGCLTLNFTSFLHALDLNDNEGLI
jgi:hypothetical protein